MVAEMANMAEDGADDGVVAEALFLGTSAVCDENKASALVFMVMKEKKVEELGAGGCALRIDFGLEIW